VDGQGGYHTTTAPGTGQVSREPAALTGTIPLEANQRYDFRLEYVHGVGPATLKVSAKTSYIGEHSVLGLLGELFDSPATKQ
jgi:hypothetical protein